MSLGLPSLRPKDVATAQDNTHQKGEYEVIKTMNTGLVSSVRDQAGSAVHPLQYSEENHRYSHIIKSPNPPVTICLCVGQWLEQREKMELMTARNMQGVHMPMKLSMERFAAKQIGRLPCMATRTSNLMMDTLTGRDEMIDVDDLFNSPTEFPERSGNVHAIMEKRLGIF